MMEVGYCILEKEAYQAVYPARPSPLDSRLRGNDTVWLRIYRKHQSKRHHKKSALKIIRHSREGGNPQFSISAITPFFPAVPD